jgi:hypothetical protein
MKPVSRTTRVLVTAALILAAALPVASQGFPGSTTLVYPERTDAGEWFGTWYYISRDAKIAIWIRTTDGLPEVKMQYFAFGTAEQFETDWQGHAEYEFKRRYPGVFDMKIEERDADTIKGRWEWTLEMENTRIERGDFTMYRAGHGRSFVMKFDNYERIVIVDGHESVWRTDQVLSFRKISKRLARWVELPF